MLRVRLVVIAVLVKFVDSASISTGSSNDGAIQYLKVLPARPSIACLLLPEADAADMGADGNRMNGCRRGRPRRHQPHRPSHRSRRRWTRIGSRCSWRRFRRS